MPSEPHSAPAAPRSSLPSSRFYVRLIAFLNAAALLAVALQGAWGEGGATSWAFLGGGALCGLVAGAGWTRLARLSDRRRAPTFLDWILFPVTTIAGLGMVPLLVLAAYPDARGWLEPLDHIAVRRRGDTLELIFPRSMLVDLEGKEGPPRTQPETNLALDDQPVPDALLDAGPGLRVWRDLAAAGDRRILTIDVAALAAALGIERPRRLGLNSRADARQTRFATGERVPQQWFDLAPP